LRLRTVRFHKFLVYIYIYRERDGQQFFVKTNPNFFICACVYTYLLAARIVLHKKTSSSAFGGAQNRRSDRTLHYYAVNVYSHQEKKIKIKKRLLLYRETDVRTGCRDGERDATKVNKKNQFVLTMPFYPAENFGKHNYLFSLRRYSTVLRRHYKCVHASQSGRLVKKRVKSRP